MRLTEILDVLRRHDIIHGVSPEKLRAILEDLGPTYVKIGQIMSMRSDVLPQGYCDELSKLRTEVTPVPFEEVERLLEQEYGVPVHEVFQSIQPFCLGSASIAQVHEATLKDGQRVVVKVQRPGIKEVMAKDIALMRKAAKILKIVAGTGNLLDFNAILDEIWITSQREMNFLLEADNLKKFAAFHQDVVYISCPKVEESMVTSKILIMEYIDGIQIDKADLLIQKGYDLNEIGLKLAENYIKQILEDGFFHADPHPGNIWIQEGKIVWLDLGMVGVISPENQALFRKILVSMVKHDIYDLSSALLAIGRPLGKINHHQLYSDLDEMLNKYGAMGIGSIQLTTLLQETMDLAKQHNVSMPADIGMLGRGLITLGGVLTAYCPGVNLMQLITNYLSAELFKGFDWQEELQRSGKAFLSTTRKSVEIPAQIYDILKMTIKGHTKVNLELTGSEEPLKQMKRMFDRLSVAVIDAALLIGSSLICTTNMHPKILDIPALGVIGFLTAAVMGAWLIHGIVKK